MPPTAVVSPFATTTRDVLHDRELAPAAIMRLAAPVRDRDPLLQKATMPAEHEYRYPDLRLQRYAAKKKSHHAGKIAAFWEPGVLQ